MACPGNLTGQSHTHTQTERERERDKRTERQTSWQTWHSPRQITRETAAQAACYWQPIHHSLSILDKHRRCNMPPVATFDKNLRPLGAPQIRVDCRYNVIRRKLHCGLQIDSHSGPIQAARKLRIRRQVPHVYAAFSRSRF